MAHYCLLLVVLMVSCYAREEIGTEGNTFKSFNEYAPNNHKIKLNKSNPPYKTFHYVVGTRVKGDGVIAERSDYITFPTPRNYTHEIWYPTSGVGSIISSLDIWINQSSKDCNIYIIKGGIGQRSIVLLIVSGNTTLLDYFIRAYGG